MRSIQFITTNSYIQSSATTENISTSEVEDSSESTYRPKISIIGLKPKMKKGEFSYQKMIIHKSGEVDEKISDKAKRVSQESFFK